MTRSPQSTPRVAAFAVLALAGALGACSETSAQEGPRPQPLPAQGGAAPAAPVPAPQQAPVAKDGEPHGQRPIDEGALRALAEEVARLRAELAKVREEKAAPAVAKPTAGPFVPGTAAPAKEAPVAEAPAPAQPTEADERPDDSPAPAVAAAPAVERVIEREVPVYVDREVPVYVDREVPVYVESPPTVIYEQVVYRDVSCYQYIPFGHVHHIGCGHHYYGCACHPWYYDLDGGHGISFLHVDIQIGGHDRDNDHRDNDRRPGRPAAGWDGHGRGGGHARDDDRRPIRESPPSEPSRRDDRPRRPVATLEDRAPTPSRVGEPFGSVPAESRSPADPARRDETRAPRRPPVPARDGGAVIEAGPDVRRVMPAARDVPEGRDAPRRVSDDRDPPVRRVRPIDRSSDDGPAVRIPRAPAPDMGPVRRDENPPPRPEQRARPDPVREDAPVRRPREIEAPRPEHHPAPPVARPQQPRAQEPRRPERRHHREDGDE